MCQLLETIKLENGIFHNLKYHNLRCNRARHELFGISQELDLEEILSVPEEYEKGLYRCRVVYSREIEKIEFISHHLRVIKSLKLVVDNSIEYSYKYLNREKLNQLYEMRVDYDEIIIVKNGLVTDCSIGNLVFYDGQKWWTPESPLLKGTQRMKLLDEQQIRETKITPDNLYSFQFAGVINVFYDLKNLTLIPITSIHF